MADLAEARVPDVRNRSTIACWIVGLTLAACVAVLFGRGFFAGELFAYRDGAHYHYPLFTYVGERWSQGEIPLWNPADNLGQPLAGDPTAAVFYPVRFVASILPVGPVRQYQAYILLHLAAAMAGAYFLARAWRCDVISAGAAAMVYGLSGAVLFQYCNVIFLVGAAWWPAALAAIEWLRKEGNWRPTMALAAALAMMILGGDAEAAYLAIALAAWRFWWSADDADAIATTAANEENPPPISATIPMSRVLVTTILLAGSLAAVQIAPSLIALAESGRAAADRPRSIYEVPAYLSQSEPAADPPSWQGVGEGLFGAPKPDTHDEHIYLFSVAPWRVAEAVVPNCLGREFPENRRWGAAVADEGGLWTPSLYFGILPLLVGLGSLRFFGGDIRSRWLSWVFLAGLVGSFGWYGLGWVIGQVQFAAGIDPTIGPQTGGLYWLFTVALPGFVQFRYPAKLLVPAMLALALLIARGWRPAFFRGDLLASRLTIVAAVSGGILLVVILARVLWDNGVGAGNAHLAMLFADRLDSPLFGPLDRAGGWWDLVGGLCQTTCISAFAAIALRMDLGSLRIYAPAAALVVTGIDLVVANGWLIQYAPPPSSGPIVHKIDRQKPDHGFEQRIYRSGGPTWWPAKWKTKDSANRLADSVAWESQTLSPKYHHLHHYGSIDSFGGPWSRRDYQMALHVARKAAGSDLLPPDFAKLLGVDWTIEPPARERRAEARRIEIPLEDGAEKVDLTLLHPRRAWIASNIVVLPALTESSSAALEARTREVLLEKDRLRDFEKVTVVEGSETLDDFPETRPPGESCVVASHSSERIDLDLDLRAPALVAVADSFDSGWTALVTEAGGAIQEGTVVRVNRVMRGVMLPAGKHRVTFAYQPPGVSVAIWIDAGAWLFWLAWIARAIWRERETPNDQAESA